MNSTTQTWIPEDDQFEERVRQSFNEQGFMHYLQAELMEVSAGHCQIKVPFRRELTQQHGFFHAGVVSTIADNTAGYAAYSLMAPNASILTVEFKVNLLRPADGDYLLGHAEVIKYGRSLTVCTSDIYAVKDGVEKLCATGQSTLIQLLPDK